MPVRNAAGSRLGRVADAGFVLDRSGGVQLLVGARLHGIVVSPHAASSFLGYEGYGVSQPWPIAQLLRWRHRGSFLVLWDDIAVMGQDAVRLREDFTAYSPTVGAPEP